MVEASRSTLAMIPKTSLVLQNGLYQVKGQSLSERGICAKERFSQQPAAANCSGFLVKDNVLVTAGHCVTSLAQCQTYRWVLDYKVSSATQTSVSVDRSDVFSCRKIIARVQNPIDQNDYAVIELDRKTGRKPLAFRRSGQIAVNTPVVVIGNPSGLPTKIADGANVRSLSGKYFTANLDTYGGNSGSAVLNAKSGEVEGVLVRGENDYVNDASGSCLISNVCPNTGCRGEDVTFIGNVQGIK